MLLLERINNMEFNLLEVVCNAAELDEEEYALIRKDSFGASDSSILCGESRAATDITSKIFPAKLPS